jgi:hypothetical protein
MTTTKKTSRPSFDERLATLFVRTASHLSRRGLLNILGTFLLRSLGVAVLPVLLPLDRRMSGGTVPNGCTAETCNMCGNYCQPCCGSTDVGLRCPSCQYMQTGGAWTGCCNHTRFQYADCCGAYASRAPCQSTHGCDLGCNNQGRAVYCPTGVYICTTINRSGCC